MAYIPDENLTRRKNSTISQLINNTKIQKQFNVLPLITLDFSYGLIYLQLVFGVINEISVGCELVLGVVRSKQQEVEPIGRSGQRPTTGGLPTPCWTNQNHCFLQLQSCIQLHHLHYMFFNINWCAFIYFKKCKIHSSNQIVLLIHRNFSTKS